MRGLRARGVDVVTALEDGAAEVDDEIVLRRATDLGRLLFTQDQDLLGIARDWQRDCRSFAGVAYAPQVGPSIGRLTEDLEAISRVLDPQDVADRVYFLPL